MGLLDKILRKKDPGPSLFNFPVKTFREKDLVKIARRSPPGTIFFLDATSYLVLHRQVAEGSKDEIS